MQPTLRGGVDDEAATGGDHDRQHRPAQVEQSVDVDRVAERPVRRIRVEQRTAPVDAGVVDQYIDPIGLLNDGGDRSGAGGCVEQIEGQ
jgi:hypothetical protein